MTAPRPRVYLDEEREPAKEAILRWAALNLSPEDVFSVEALSAWAKDNGWKQADEED